MSLSVAPPIRPANLVPGPWADAEAVRRRATMSAKPARTMVILGGYGIPQNAVLLRETILDQWIGWPQPRSASKEKARASPGHSRGGTRTRDPGIMSSDAPEERPTTQRDDAS